MEPKRLSTKEVCAEAGVSPDQLIRWEAAGLLPPSVLGLGASGRGRSKYWPAETVGMAKVLKGAMRRGKSLDANADALKHAIRLSLVPKGLSDDEWVAAVIREWEKPRMIALRRMFPAGSSAARKAPKPTRGTVRQTFLGFVEAFAEHLGLPLKVQAQISAAVDSELSSVLYQVRRGISPVVMLPSSGGQPQVLPDFLVPYLLNPTLRSTFQIGAARTGTGDPVPSHVWANGAVVVSLDNALGIAWTLWKPKDPAFARPSAFLIPALVVDRVDPTGWYMRMPVKGWINKDGSFSFELHAELAEPVPPAPGESDYAQLLAEREARKAKEQD